MNRAKNMRCTSSICEQSLCKVLIKMNENFWSYRLQKLGAPKVLRMDGRTDRPQGGTLICFYIRRLGPSIYPYPPKNIRFSSAPKKYLKFLQPKKISRFCIFTLRKDPKIHRKNPLKLVQFGDDPKKISTKFSYPKKYSFFWTPKKWYRPTYV